MTVSNTINANLAAEISSLGMEDRTANEIMGRALPPKLMAAVLMADAAFAGEVNAAHMDGLMGYYYGNQLPASIAQQKSKFKVFVDCGVRQQPIAATVRFAAELIEARRAIVAEMSTGKDRDREQKAVDKMQAGIFEKGTALARLQGKKGGTMLDREEILSVLCPDAKVSENPLADGIEGMIKTLERLVTSQGNFLGHDDITKHLAAALAAAHAGVTTPVVNAPVITEVPVTVPVQNNVVALPAPKSVVVLPADVELDDLVGGLVAVG